MLCPGKQGTEQLRYQKKAENVDIYFSNEPPANEM